MKIAAKFLKTTDNTSVVHQPDGERNRPPIDDSIRTLKSHRQDKRLANLGVGVLTSR